MLKSPVIATFLSGSNFISASSSCSALFLSPFELGEKLDHHFKVKFHGESNSDGPVVKKLSRPRNGPLRPYWSQKLKNLKFDLG